MTANRRGTSNHRGTSNYIKTLERKKDKLKELAGETTEAAFQRVRLLVRETGRTWLDAYDHVIHELEQANKESK